MKQTIALASEPDHNLLDVQQRVLTSQKHSNSEFTSTLKINFSNHDKKSQDNFSFTRPVYPNIMPVKISGENIIDSVLPNPVSYNLAMNTNPTYVAKHSFSSVLSHKNPLPISSFIPHNVNESSKNNDAIPEKHSILISNTESKDEAYNVRSKPEILPSDKDVIPYSMRETNAAHTSHPYVISTISNSKLVPIHTVDSDIITNSQSSEKSDTISLSNKKPNIYKPRLNRPTRYPIPLKGDTSRESIKFQTQYNKLERFKVASSSTNVNSLQSNIEDKSLLRDRLKPTIDFPNSMSNLKPSIGFRKLHSPNSIVTANLTKVQSRIFVPENMDFSQLSDVDMEIKQRQTNKKKIESGSKVIKKRSEEQSASRPSGDSDTLLTSEKLIRFPVVSKSMNMGFTCSIIDSQPNFIPHNKYIESNLKNNVLTLEHSSEKHTPHIMCAKSQLPIHSHNETHNISKDESLATDTNVDTAIPSKPLSLAKNDLQIWIKNTIDIKDSITAAYLISSHIFEKTYQSISQRHALERRELEIYYDSKIKILNEKHDALQKQFSILYITKPATNIHHCNNRSSIHRVISLPTNLAVYESSLLLGTTLPTCNALSKLTTNRSQFGNVSATHKTNNSCPSPPPDLPEVVLKVIPLPPPDLPSVPNFDVITTCANTSDLQTAIFPKTKNRKQSIMKPLHWKRLCLPGRKNKHEIIWKILPKSKIKSSELIVFEELFSTQKPRKSLRPVIAINFRSTLPQEILPLEISKQIGVIFKNIESVNIHLEDIAEMLYTGDIKSSHLTTSILENLCKLVTDEWINVVKSYVHKNPNAELSKETKVLQFFCDIPNVNMRFQNLLYMENFEEEIRHIHRNIDIISNCCSKLKNSNELRILLSIILLLGNYMNQTYDSFKEALGFNLELLPRLKETKTCDNSSTFLDFVSRCYLLTFEHSISQGSINNILPFPDTGDLFVASKITLKDLYEGLSNLGEQLTKIRENTRHFLDDSIRNNSHKFVEIVENFFVFAEKKISSEIELWKVGEKTYKELIFFFYGETKDVWEQPDTHNFFGIWCNFAGSFKESLLKEHKNIVIKRRNDFNKAGTKIIPISSSGLKQKVKFHAGNKVRFSHSLQSVNIH